MTHQVARQLEKAFAVRCLRRAIRYTFDEPICVLHRHSVLRELEQTQEATRAVTWAMGTLPSYVSMVSKSEGAHR